MRSVLLSLAVCLGFVQAQIQPPFIGQVRDRNGRVVPVFGIAGTFTLGPPLVEGAIEASFGPDGGFFKTTEGWFAVHGGSRTRLPESAAGLVLTTDDAWIRSECPAECQRAAQALTGETERCPDRSLTVEDFASRLDLPEPISAVERMSADWYVLRGDRGLYAVRWRAGGEPEMWQLPEGEQEEQQEPVP